MITHFNTDKDYYMTAHFNKMIVPRAEEVNKQFHSKDDSENVLHGPQVPSCLGALLRQNLSLTKCSIMTNT